MKNLRIGVVGYSGQKFNIETARKMLNEAYDELQDKYPVQVKIVVSGLTALGIPLLAYEEAEKRNWVTVGIACKKQKNTSVFQSIINN